MKKLFILFPFMVLFLAFGCQNDTTNYAIMQDLSKVLSANIKIEGLRAKESTIFRQAVPKEQNFTIGNDGNLKPSLEIFMARGFKATWSDLSSNEKENATGEIPNEGTKKFLFDFQTKPTARSIGYEIVFKTATTSVLKGSLKVIVHRERGTINGIAKYGIMTGPTLTDISEDMVSIHYPLKDSIMFGTGTEDNIISPRDKAQLGFVVPLGVTIQVRGKVSDTESDYANIKAIRNYMETNTTNLAVNFVDYPKTSPTKFFRTPLDFNLVVGSDAHKSLLFGVDTFFEGTETDGTSKPDHTFFIVLSPSL